MGTRSLTFVYDGDEPIINLYRQYDGYPAGHGAELADFINGYTIGNGIGSETPAKYANGIGCLAAQLISHFKGTEAGQFYLYPTSHTDCGQDYEYHIHYSRAAGMKIRVVDRGCNMFGMTQSDTNESIFSGTLAEFAEFCTEKAAA